NTVSINRICKLVTSSFGSSTVLNPRLTLGKVTWANAISDKRSMKIINKNRPLRCFMQAASFLLFCSIFYRESARRPNHRHRGLRSLPFLARNYEGQQLVHLRLQAAPEF